MKWSDIGKGGVGVSSKELKLHNIYGNNSYIDLTEQLKNAYSKLD
ncbi:MAG: hypothetical protein AB7V56_11270 [Candidatus Nitrosocosmicus sp.]